jgi:cyanophycin synthetase
MKPRVGQAPGTGAPPELLFRMTLAGGDAMNFRHVRCLRGPNVWAACPVIEAALDLGDGRAWSVEDTRQTIDRLGADLPGMRSATAPDGEVPLGRLARAFGLVALKLQDLAGTPVSFTAVAPTSGPALFRVAVEFAEEPVGRAAAETALRLLQAAADGRPLPLAEELRRLQDLAYDQRLPASTRVVYDAARARGIPAARLNREYGRYIRLGQGAKQHRCRASEPDTVSAVARMASTDKHLAKQLLREAGVPVPEGRLVESAAEAWAAAGELGLPVAVKPVDSDLATGVSLDLHTRDQVEAAFACAQEHSSSVLVERFAPGVEHRVLVVGDRVVAVTRIEPPHVIGDGTATVADLVARVNRDPRRGDMGSGSPLAKIQIDEVAIAILAAQGLTPDSVPASRVRVLLRRNPPYFKNGGSLVDVTDRLHPSTAGQAVAAAQAVQLPVAGLDVVAVDIARPLEDQGGVVVEINTSPGLWLHMAPWADSPRPIGDDIVASLFTPGNDGRIPVAAIVGDAAGAATGHLTALLTLAGRRVGSAGESGIVVAGRRWNPQAQTPQERANVLMQNPAVDVALLQTTPDELVRAGFSNDRCDVALLLDPGTVAEGDDIGPEPGDYIQALWHALASEGTLVIDAEGEPAGTATRLPVRQRFLIARQANLARLRQHLEAGGRALVVEGGAVAVAQSTAQPVLLSNFPTGVAEHETPGLLAALAAGLVLGLDAATLKAYLATLA